MPAFWSPAVGLLLGSLAFSAIGQDNPVLVGTVTKVTDGDTIKVELSSGPSSVRFGNIDAPESNQPRGPEAKAALTELVLRKEVSLDVMEQDRYERLVAVVYLGEENLNARLVKLGHAWAYRQYSSDADYCIYEQAARSIGRGLWAEEGAVAPWEWQAWRRDQTRAVTDYSGETAAKCVAALRKRKQQRAGGCSLRRPGTTRESKWAAFRLLAGLYANRTQA